MLPTRHVCTYITVHKEINLKCTLCPLSFIPLLAVAVEVALSGMGVVDDRAALVDKAALGAQVDMDTQVDMVPLDDMVPQADTVALAAQAERVVQQFQQHHKCNHHQ